MPLHRRVPKRGFHNSFRVEYDVVNLDTLAERFDAGADGDAGAAARARPRRQRTARVKVLARGDIDEGADRARAQVQRQGGREDRGGRRHGRGARVAVSRGQTTACSTALKNIFAVPDLRKRVLFTLGLLAVYRVGGHIPTPGVNSEALAHAGRAGAEHDVRPLRHVLGPEPVADDDLRAGHHAVHQRVDHPAAADGGLAVPRAALEGRRARPPQDHAVHALRHDRC